MISAHLTVDPHFAIGRIRRQLFGGFVEHLGRHIYDGIYEPAHPSADAEGFRTDVIDLVKTFQKVLDRAKSRPMLQVDEEAVTVGQMIDYLRRRLTLEERPVRLLQLLRSVNSRNALVCTFLALLEMVRLQAIQVRQDRLFGEIVVRKHTGFDAIMNEQAAVRDDWR